MTFWTTRYCGLNYVCSLPSYHKALSNREWNANSLTWNIFLFSCNVWHSCSRTKCLQFTSIWKWGSWNSEIVYFWVRSPSMSRSSQRRGRSAGLFPDQRLVIEPIYFIILKTNAPIHPQSPTLFFSFLFIQRCGEQKGQLLKTRIFPTVFADDQHLNISSGK